VTAGCLRLMQRLAQQVWLAHRETVNSGATVGQLAWEWGSGRAARAASWRQRVWLADGDPVAWGWVYPPEQIRVSASEWALSDTSLVWQVHPERTALLDDVLTWFDDQADGAPQVTAARAGDVQALGRLRRRGYRHDPAAPWFRLNDRGLGELALPGLPPGFRLVTGATADPALAVAAHRAAWAPSAFTGGDLAEVRSIWPYRADLAAFVQAPGGQLAASALAWYDEVAGTAELEPVGTDPAFRRLGLGRAVSLFALHQARAAGATRAIVSCRGDDRYPVPGRLYRSLGFTELSRDVVMRRRPG
jgi:GNAT superfamily N-acetyltransferase